MCDRDRMIRNPTFLLNVQIAFIGILVVVGLFYLWRYMSRLEEKVDTLGKILTSRPPVSQMPMHMAPPPMMDDDLEVEQMMREVFSQTPIILNTYTDGAEVPASAAGVQIEEVNAQRIVEDDTPSVSVGLSKSKVRRMTSEALRETCKERGLSTEGSRPELMERVLATLEDVHE
jgi:hypothetical protein